jgi:predicted nicotinamide N-methyase
MKKAAEITAPQSLGSFFADSSDEEQEFEQLYEEQNIKIGSQDLVIRQFCWHQANANKVWPGTFNLAKFITQHEEHYSHGRILELGAATGALSIYLIKQCDLYDIVTSDIDDGGDVQENILFNFNRNGTCCIPPFVPYTDP